MSFNLNFSIAGEYLVEDDGSYGNNTSVVRNSIGQVISTFVHPTDSINFTTNISGVNLQFNFTDHLGAANLTAGVLGNPTSSFNSIKVNQIQITGVVTLVSNSNVVENNLDFAPDIIAGKIIISALTGIGAPTSDSNTYNPIDTQTGILEARTSIGGILINNFGTVQVGGGNANVHGLDVATSGNISLDNTGSILLGNTASTETIHGGMTSGNVTLAAQGYNADIRAITNQDSIVAAGGNITLTAGRDIAFGVAGTGYDNDVRAKGALTVNAGRDFIIDGHSQLASDDFGGNSGGNLAINAVRNIEIRGLSNTESSILANNAMGSDVSLKTGTDGAFILSTPTQNAIQSATGDVLVSADRMLISGLSGITASSGSVTLTSATKGYQINLGSTSDTTPFSVELSDSELARIFTPMLIIGSDLNTGKIIVSAPVSFVADSVKLIGSDVIISGDISSPEEILISARHTVYHTAGVISTGVLNVYVNSKGIVDLGNNIIANQVFINGSSSDDILRGSNIGDTISGFIGNDTLYGAGGNDTLYGGFGDNLLFGNEGNDTLNGYFGSAKMEGGLGDDIYHVDSADDIVIEVVNAGNDKVLSSITYDLSGKFVEQLTLLGNAYLNATGNSLNNILNGNTGNNILNGGAGVDTMQGGLGADTYYVDNIADVVIEEINQVQGVDRILSSVSYTLSQFVEQLELIGSANIDATGNSLNNVLSGNTGNNILNGGIGTDTMQGGLGNDTYYVDNVADVVVEAINAGTDKIFSTVTYSIATQFVELLELTGSSNINASGNNLNNFLIGNTGNNVLNGGVGVDTMQGGLGNDSYFVDNASDIVAEASGAGIDTIYSTVSFVQSVNVENLVLLGATNINATGNSLANLLKGNTGNNLLDGQAGNDTLVGVSGADTAMYQLLNGADARGGNGSDSWTDFTVGNTAINTNADKIDIGDLLIGYGGGGTLAALDPYLTVNISGSNTTVLIDRDGAGGTYTDILLLTLNGVNTSLLTLINNNQILI